MKAIPVKETRKLLFTPIIENNPIALQILGICSALAVTVKMDVTLITVSYTHLRAHET